MPTQIVFFGSSPFSIVVLKKLLSTEHCGLSAVVTTPDKPASRHLKLTPNPVKVFAQKHNLPVFDNIRDFLIKDWPNCVGLVAAYGKLIGPKTLSKLNNRIFGIHPSLLPKYRGPSPLQQQILDGIIETGVTILKIDLGEDSGPIMAQGKDVILPTDTKISLGERLFSKGIDLFLNNLESIIESKGTPQDNKIASDTRIITRQDGFIPWEKFQPEKLDRKLRAFDPWPGVWTLTPDGKRVKLIQLHPLQFLLENQSRLVSLEQLLSASH